MIGMRLYALHQVICKEQPHISTTFEGGMQAGHLPFGFMRLSKDVQTVSVIGFISVP